MELIFVRHGETLNNVEDRLQGVSDSDLTGVGRNQAKRLAEFCKKLEIDEICSSPLKRALTTTEEVSKLTGIKVKIESALREISYGSWEQCKKSELRKTSLWKTRKIDKFNFLHPGTYDHIKGESYRILFDRVSPFLDSLVRNKSDKKILVIGHLGISRVAKKHFENVSDEQAASFNPKNNQAYVVVLEENVVKTSLLDF